MTATQVQIRRDTAANLAAATPADGELAYDTTNDRLSIGDGTTLGGIKLPNFSDIQKQSFAYATAGGTADALTLTFSPALLAYASGVKLSFKAASNNTGSATMNVNTLGAKTIKKVEAGSKANLEADDLVSGLIYEIVYDGTDFIIYPLQSGGSEGGMTLLSVQTASASASLNFASIITSDYSSYLFEIDNIRPATDATVFAMRTSTNNGSSYDSTAGHYNYAIWYYTSSAFNTINHAGPGTTFLGMTPSNAVGNGGSEGISGKVFIANPLNATQYKRASFELGYTDTSGAFSASHGIGARLSVSDVDAVQFLMNSGNITSGTIRCYGLKAAI